MKTAMQRSREFSILPGVLVCDTGFSFFHVLRGSAQSQWRRGAMKVAKKFVWTVTGPLHQHWPGIRPQIKSH
jgi:hypothetical protein